MTMDEWQRIAEAMRVVWRVYRAELLREPDPDCSGWVAEIATGHMTEAQMVEAIRLTGEWAAVHAPKPEPVPVPQPSLRGRLRVEGRRLVGADGQPFAWRGVTGFRLLELTSSGRIAEATWFLEWARQTGFNVVRVLGMCKGMFSLSPTFGAYSLGELLDLAAAHGLYLHVTALADTASYPDLDYGAHVEALGSVCAQHENVALLEASNEPYHGSQASAVHDVANLQRWAARVPQGVLVALGASAEDESREMDDAPVIVAHLDRGRDPWNMARRVRELETLSADSGRYVINSEPIGAAETDQPGRRSADPAIHAAFGALSRIFGVGSTFHCEAGLQAVVPGPVQQACAAAFIAGTRIVPDDVALEFRNARWPDSPVKDARFAEGPPKPDTCVRAYSGISGNAGVLALVGVSGDPGVVYGGGWQPGRVVLELPGLRVLELRR
jgi:hypothetical protein